MMFKGYDAKNCCYIRGENGKPLVMNYDQWTKWALENQGNYGYLKLEETTEIENSKLVETKSETTESTLYEATSLFMSKADVRSYVLDNRDIYEGYIIRSLNNWDSDTIYRWEEKDNGKIIWRKEKA